MPDYTVKWEIDLEADTPREAAERALEYILDVQGMVRVFEVTHYPDPSEDESALFPGETTTVDLNHWLVNIPEPPLRDDE